MAGNDRLVGIQATRGAAALLVVFYHAGRMLSLDQYVGHDPFHGLFSFGHAGVDFFFVLSGFIIYFVHNKDIGSPRRVSHYAWRRFARIYPIYWVVTLASVPLLLAGHHYSELTPSHIAASFLLLPQAQDPIVGVAWTLEHEVLFYTIFATLIARARIGMLLCVAWMLFIAIGIFVPIPGVLGPFAASPYHLDFFLGMAAAWLVIHQRVPSPLLATAAGLLLFFATGIADNMGAVIWWSLLDKLLFGASSCLVIAGLAAAERRGLLSFGRTAEFVGGMSYSLYLVHPIFIGLTAHALMNASIIHHLPELGVAALCVVAALTGAAGIYVLIEKPMLAWLQSIGRATRPRLRSPEPSTDVPGVR